MKRINIILDTDIGDDIDDAFALACLLNMQDKVNIVGITTVFVNSDHRARMVKKLLHLHHDNNIPVYAGIREGDGSININGECCQFTEDLLNDEYKPNNDVYKDNGEGAVSFLINKAKEYQDDLTIVCIGPYSNIGRAIAKDKEAFSKCKIVTMGGNFFSRAFVEWNIYCDPKNAKVLLESGLDVTCLGIDVTKKTRLTNKQYENILSYTPNDFYKYMVSLITMHKNYQKNPKTFRPYLHDPLALFYAVFNDYVKVKKQLIKVEVNGTYTSGETVNIDYLFRYEREKRKGNRINIAYSFDKEKFMDDFMKIYKK